MFLNNRSVQRLPVKATNIYYLTHFLKTGDPGAAELSNSGSGSCMRPQSSVGWKAVKSTPGWCLHHMTVQRLPGVLV